MILEQIAADTRLRLIEEKKLVSPEEMKEKALALAADETFPFEKMLKEPGIQKSFSIQRSDCRRFSISADCKRIRSSRCRCHLLPDRAEIFSRKERIFKSDHR